MIYKIIIEKKEVNPNFEVEYKQWQDDSRYGRSFDNGNIPQRERVTNALICELTEEQFKAVKGNVLEVFY